MSRAERVILIANVIAAVFLSSAAAASDCADSSGDAAIADCTSRINSGKFRGHDQAVNYYNRGWEYDEKHDYDRAIADYNSAIGIDPKYAKAYNNRGWVYQTRGDYERAVADYNIAIGIDPKHAKALNNRGLAYYHFGDYDRAISDYDTAIGSDPKFAAAYANRGSAYEHKGDYNRAVADLNEAIGLNAKDGGSYFNRGRINLYGGSLDRALADFNQANALSPKYAYGALWLEIVSQRSHLPSRLAQASSQVDMTAWPGPVIRLLLGQMTPAAVLAAADNPDSFKKKSQVCEANFYTGEMSLSKGSKDEAIRLFRLAASDCPHHFLEWSSANAELKSLGATP